MGTVITGSGCSFDLWTRDVVAEHLLKDVRAEIRAVQSGQCEKAWAVPVWLLVEGIPAEYSGSFLLDISAR